MITVLKRKFTAIFIMVALLLSFAATALAYIGNHNTYKFHHDGCRYVARMNEGNKVWFDTREEAINAGYIPCKVCRP